MTEVVGLSIYMQTQQWEGSTDDAVIVKWAVQRNRVRRHPLQTEAVNADSACLPGDLCRHDAGEFGDAPLKILSEYLLEHESMLLFVDGRKVPGASVEVSGTWAVWMQRHRKQLKEIHILCGSRFIQLTANFVRRFAGLEEQMSIYTEAPSFDLAVGKAIAQNNSMEP